MCFVLAFVVVVVAFVVVVVVVVVLLLLLLLLLLKLQHTEQKHKDGFQCHSARKRNTATSSNAMKGKNRANFQCYCK